MQELFLSIVVLQNSIESGFRGILVGWLGCSVVTRYTRKEQHCNEFIESSGGIRHWRF